MLLWASQHKILIMNNEVKFQKISMALTVTNDKLPAEAQNAVLSQWASIVPRMIVMGPFSIRAPGVRYFPSASSIPLAHLLGSYVMDIPGAEICLLASPTFELSDNIDALSAFVSERKIQLAWGGRLTHGEVPYGFVMSASLISHMINDIPATISMDTDKWAAWVHGWMLQRMPPSRYLDINSYNVVRPKPVMNAYVIDPPTVEKKKIRK